MCLQKRVHSLPRELCAGDRRGQAGPPSWWFAALREPHQSKLAHVRKHQGALSLKQNQMIMFAWCELNFGRPKFPSHAEVNAQPKPARKPKEHLFAAGR